MTTDAVPPFPPPTPAAPPPGAPQTGTSATSTSDERTIALLVHLATLVSTFLGPLVIWLIKKDESAYVDHHGKEALNFQITVLLAAIVLLIPSWFLCGLPHAALGVADLVLTIVAAVRASEGALYRYPLTLRLIS